MIDFNIQNELQPVLSAGEKLIWTGRPKGGIVFRSSDAVMIPFSLVWASLVLFIFPFTGGVMPFPFSLVHLFFVIVALYITIGRFLQMPKSVLRPFME